MKKLIEIGKAVLGVAFILSLTVGAFADSSAYAANYPITGQQYYLSGAGVTSSQNTVSLTSFKTPDGRAITMTMIGDTGYGTLEPQSSAKVELITFTGITQNGNGSATLTGVTRGIDFAYPYAASSAYRQSHSGGSTFIISATPNWFYDQFDMPANANVNIWPFASTSPATKGYVDYVAFNGAAVINANTTNKGVVQIATGAQAAASTATGSTGATLVLPASVATSTWNSATAGNVIPVSSLSTKKIADGFISTSTLLAATSTINIGAFPAWQIGKQMQVFSSTGTTTFSVPSGISKVQVQVQAGGASGGGGNSGGAGGGGGGGYAFENVDVTGTTTIQVFVGSGGAAVSGGTDGNPGTWSTFGTNGFYLSASPGIGGGRSNGTPTGGAPGIGSGGDINISGDGGGPGTSATAGFSGGKGGGSHMGGGGNGVAASGTGGTGGNYGGGGGGGSTTSGSATSGAGAQGVVIVSW